MQRKSADGWAKEERGDEDYDSKVTIWWKRLWMRCGVEMLSHYTFTTWPWQDLTELPDHDIALRFVLHSTFWPVDV